AALGDFCIALYNPSSKKRHDYLARAAEILLRRRRGETPCGWVRNIGRAGESFALTEGEMCIVPPRVPHNHPLEPEDLVLGIVVRKSTFDSIFGSLLTNNDLVSTFFRNALYGADQSNYLRLKTERLPRIEQLVQQLAYEAGRSDLYANACCVSLLNLFLAEALRQYSDTITFYRMESYAQHHGDFALILQYIQQNFRSVTLASLAEAFHYSETYLCKLIQRNLNQSFTETVRSLKMARAAEYLTHTQLKIAEIADLVGYDSVDHFSRTFRARYGMPPREYRKHAEQ
ncbi:MAG: helix-turn-helix domain-containing protein, partial [Clostridia bacterium]|nr:helix-turn-helix domain-containing protein [Clostridia bacterium]